jgi:hypothetical protein
MNIRDFTRTLVEEKRIGETATRREYISLDKATLFGEVSAMGGRLVVEKSFPNTFTGREAIKKFLNNFETDEDIKTYFKLKNGDIVVNLEQLAQEIQKNRALAEEEIDEKGNPATLKSRIARKRAAQSRLEPLYVQYKSELRPRTLFVLAVGDKKDEFASVAASQGVDVQNIDVFYEDLVSRLNPALYSGRESVTVLFDVLGRILEEKAIELNIASYPQLVFKQKYATTIKSKEDALAVIKKAVNEQVGPEMAALDVLERAARNASKQNFSDSTYGVIVTLSDESIAASIVEGLQKISQKTALVIAGTSETSEKAVAKVSEVNEDSVVQALMKVAKHVKKVTKK